MPAAKKLTLPIITFAILLYIVFYTPPPKAWPEATVSQILLFFLPLLAFLAFLLNIFIEYLPKSFSIALGLVFLLVLQAIGQLGIVTAGITITAIMLITGSLKHTPKRACLAARRGSLTSKFKIFTLSRFKPRKGRHKTSP